MAIAARELRPTKGDPEALRRAAELARPVTLAGDRSLPVLDALAPLLPQGIRRGATVTVAGPSGAGSTALALALGAAASRAGAWCAVVGHRSLGLAAAAELGLACERVLVVPEVPPPSWATVVAALVDAVDVVYARVPPGRRGVHPADARRLAARTREREAVLVPLGGRWDAGADLRLAVSSPQWTVASNRLVARRVTVTASGKGVHARERRVDLWLPNEDGEVAACA